ncbi:MAG: hypothetical protein AAFN92_16950, partial [Bacteroidota bacterium]
EDGKRFSRYLHSPFFVENPIVGPLFDLIFTRYLANDNRPVRVADLYNAFLKKYASASREKRLRKALAVIPARYADFRAHEKLDNSSVEKSRLTVMALQNGSNEDYYESCCEQWQAAADLLPAGLDRAYHQWAVAHANFFCFERKKEVPGESLFNVARVRLDNFKRSLAALYQAERFNITNLTAGENERLPPILNSEDPLLTCHRLMGILLNGTGFDETAYDDFTSHFLELSPALDPKDRTVLLQQTFNYLVGIKRQGFIRVQAREWRTWTERILRGDIALEVPFVSKAFFLNRLQAGIMSQSPELMLSIVDFFRERLPREDVPEIEYHVAIALAFCRHDYEQVTALVEQAKWKSWKDTFADSYRIKSYRVRAYLCLFARQRVTYETLSVAIGDFQRHLNKSKQGIAQSRNLEVVYFLQFCRKISTAMLQNNFREFCDELIREMETLVYFHSQYWLIDFVRQADKRRRPILERIEPAYLPEDVL